MTFAPLLAAAQDVPELYLLDFHADGYRLAESVPAYQARDTVFVDFGLFVEALEFPIHRNGDLWSGWFRNEERQFAWRKDLGLVQVGDSHGEKIERDEWMEEYDDTFVSVAVLERWFELELDVDLGTQVLGIHSNEALPFQLWRERMLAKYRYRPGGQGDADVIVPDVYHWGTIPLVDFSSNLLVQRRGESSFSSGTASIAMGMDLLKHSVVYAGGFSTSSAGDGESTNRVTIERRSSAPNAPMFAGVHGYSLGDIYQAASNLVVDSNTGRGFSVNRYPQGRSQNLGTATIVGDAPPGWEVELYRNSVLLEIATVGPDGRYFFPDEEIPFGENVFVARLYGPQGQTREDRQTYWGGGTNLAEGDYDFSISHIDFDRYLFDGTPEDADALSARYATSFSYSRALTKDLQLGAGYTRTGLGTPERDGTYTDADYLSFYGSSKFGPGILVGEMAHRIGSGQAWHIEYLTAFKGHQLSVAHRALNDYVSPATVHREDIEAIDEISLYGLFGEDKQHAYTFRLRHRGRADGPSDVRLFNQLSLRIGQVNVANDIEHTLTSGISTTNGHLRIASRINGISMRGQLDYLLSDKQPLRQVSASMNWELGRRLNNNFTISKRLTDTRDIFITDQLSLRIRDYDVTFSMTSDLAGDWSVGAGFNVAFGYDRYTQSFITDNGSLANSGRATMNLFIDENNDGVWNPGESPVGWASYRDQETLQTVPGALPLTSLPSSRPVQLDMKYLKLEDPFLVPRGKIYELNTHAGSDVTIDVAVVMTGDIEGHVLAGTPADDAPARNIIVTLHDAKGREIARTRSEFDGFYNFTGVPGGDYEVRVYANRGETELARKFSLDPQDGYVVIEKIYVFE